jgi:hypothetical protein
MPVVMLCRPAMMATLLTAAVIAGSHSSQAATTKRELTPADAIATVRIMQNQLVPGEPVDTGEISPDGNRYLLRLAYGDVSRNGVWVDLITGRLDSMASALHPVRCAHLFTSGLGSPIAHEGAEGYSLPSNLVRWVNNHEVAFLWNDAHQVRQVMSVNLITCKDAFLTHSPTPVFSFGIAPNGTLLYDAKVPRPPSASSRLWAQGFTVSDASDAWSILNGNVDGANVLDADYNNTWLVSSPHKSVRAVDMIGRRVDRTNPNFREISVSPTGRFALTNVGVYVTPDAWSRYADSALQSLFQVNKTMLARIPLSFALIDLQVGTSRLLWDAPKGFHAQILWAPRRNSPRAESSGSGSPRDNPQDDVVLLAPTFLPLAANDPAGLAGAAAAEVNVATGHYTILPIDLRSRAIVNAVWLSADCIEIHSTDLLGGDSRAQRFNRRGDAWEIADPGDAASDAQREQPQSTIKIDTRQFLNSPPQVFAVDPASGDSHLILDPNPHLQEVFKLGKVERISGKLPTGQQWLGQLIYPADYIPGRKYPLIIQSLYGKAWAEEEFTLDGSWGGSGMGLGPSGYASYPGQLLATRNIAVLELEVLHPSTGVKEAEDYQLAFETAAEQLSSSGLIDRSKVALAGFSRHRRRQL